MTIQYYIIRSSLSFKHYACWIWHRFVLSCDKTMVAAGSLDQVPPLTLDKEFLLFNLLIRIITQY